MDDYKSGAKEIIKDVQKECIAKGLQFNVNFIDTVYNLSHEQ